MLQSFPQIWVVSHCYFRGRTLPVDRCSNACVECSISPEAGTVGSSHPVGMQPFSTLGTLRNQILQVFLRSYTTVSVKDRKSTTETQSYIYESSPPSAQPLNKVLASGSSLSPVFVSRQWWIKCSILPENPCTLNVLLCPTGRKTAIFLLLQYAKKYTLSPPTSFWSIPNVCAYFKKADQLYNPRHTQKNPCSPLQQWSVRLFECLRVISDFFQIFSPTFIY